MAVIGTWGSLVFSVKQDEIKTFDKLKWEVGAKYTTHTRHLQAPLLEFTGTDVESISFSMFLSISFGINPRTDINKLVKSVQEGEYHRLVLGTDNYGKWVIEKISTTMEQVDNYGNLIAATVSVTMKSYAER